jgi:hypothetical protein
VRLLTFSVVVAIILRNGMKSLQNSVSEALSWLGLGTASASAYSQARYKLKHTAFIELNRQAVVETVYCDDDYRRFWGFRVLAVDGLKIALPDTKDVRNEFGVIGEKPWALASVLYDVLNQVALDLLLGELETAELLERLTALFLQNPTLIRERQPPRKKSTDRALLDFHKRRKKHCF